jgi:hypothetical protein
MTLRQGRGTGVGRLILLLTLGGLAGGCVRADLGQALEDVSVASVAEGFEEVRREPLNARAHMDAALRLLCRANRTQADIQLAKSAFQTAARLAPDLWEPMAGLAAAHYRLGEYREAMEATIRAYARAPLTYSLYGTGGSTVYRTLRLGSADHIRGHLDPCSPHRVAA